MKSEEQAVEVCEVDLDKVLLEFSKLIEQGRAPNPENTAEVIAAVAGVVARLYPQYPPMPPAVIHELLLVASTGTAASGSIHCRGDEVISSSFLSADTPAGKTIH